jgi:hypothetical protein
VAVCADREGSSGCWYKCLRSVLVQTLFGANEVNLLRPVTLSEVDLNAFHLMHKVRTHQQAVARKERNCNLAGRVQVNTNNRIRVCPNRLDKCQVRKTTDHNRAVRHKREILRVPRERRRMSLLDATGGCRNPLEAVGKSWQLRETGRFCRLDFRSSCHDSQTATRAASPRNHFVWPSKQSRSFKSLARTDSTSLAERIATDN